MRFIRGHTMRRRTVGLLVLVAGAGLALTGGPAQAKRPVKPPPEPPPSYGGVIYYSVGFWNGPVYEIGADGSGLREMHGNVAGRSEPSLLLHPDPEAAVQGEPVPQARWFLQEEVVGEIEQLFAVSENGTRHQLYSDATLQAGGTGGDYLYPRWSDGDRVVAFPATRLDANGDPVADESGLYMLGVDPDTMRALDAPAYVPLPSYAGSGSGGGGNARNIMYDLSRDGASVAYSSWNEYDGLWRADLDQPAAAVQLVGSGVGTMRWRPDGVQIVYDDLAGIFVIDADGTDNTLLLADPEDAKNREISIFRPNWSPTGEHVAYNLATRRLVTGARGDRHYPPEFEIWIMAADGSGPTQLCEGFLRGWR